MESQELLTLFDAMRASLSACLEDLHTVGLELKNTPVYGNLKSARSSATLGQMWLGKAKGDVGAPSPYKGSDNAAAPVVSPTTVPVAPRTETVYAAADAPGKNTLLRVVAHWRKRLQEIADLAAAAVQASTNAGRSLSLVRTHCEESRMWLGSLMQHIDAMP